MTSGIFHTVAIDAITIPDRQRKQIKDIDDLADSIRRLGLIHPIILTRDFTLVVGERRLRACTKLGWTAISFQYIDEADKTALALVELEENIKRDDLPWPDRIEVFRRLHEEYKKETPDWTEEKTAERTGWSQQTISDYLIASQIVKKQPELKNKSLATAVHVASTNKQQAFKAAELKILGYDMAKPDPGGPILNTDFITWVEIYDGPPFNFIHCDFPYGIGSDKFHQGARQLGLYEDALDIYDKLIYTLVDNINRLCSEDCHLIFWYSPQLYHYTRECLNHYFILDPYPLVWVKSDNVGILPDPRRGYRRIYETAFFGYRGDAKVISPRSNAVYAPTSARGIHPHEKPVAVLTHFLGAFVNEHTRAFDPTAGSGTALRAAAALGAKMVLGTEGDAEFARRANEEFRRADKESV